MSIYKTILCGLGLYNCGDGLYNYARSVCNGFHKGFHNNLMDKETGNMTNNSAAANNQYGFISKKISVLLLSLICVLTLAACEGGSKKKVASKRSSSTAQIPPLPSGPISVSNLRVIPNDTNATLSWNNPDANITQINITYRNIADSSEGQEPPITDRNRTLPNADVTTTITGLTNEITYIFNVLLVLGGADENRSIIVRESSRQIGPNLDGDEEVDAIDEDDDNDGVNDDIDFLPDDKSESADLDNDGVGDNRDLCDYPGSIRNWRVGEVGEVGEEVAVDMDGDGCRGDGTAPEDADDNNATKYAFEVLNLRVIPGAANATFSWNNPDVNIAQINISYKLSTAANFEDPITIRDSAKIVRNAMNVNYNISGLTADIYTFNILLVLGGDDEGRNVVTTSITRLIGPNLDGDKYADADPLELDEDGDNVNDDIDAFPRNITLSSFVVTGLAAAAGDNNVILSWNNPNAQIANISISYKVAGSTDEPLTKSSTQITPDAQNVQETIGGLTNGQLYNFNVSLVLTGADIDKKVVEASITAIPNIFGVRELVAIPGIDNVTLIWDNPDADIASINISYHNASAPDILQYFPLITDSSKIGRNVMDVQQFINGLTDGEPYTFIVGLTLNRTYVDGAVEEVSVNVTPGIFSVVALQATPGASDVTLSWRNPNAQIASINISYQIEGSNDVQYWDLIEDPAQIESNKINVQETITGLTNGVSYTFNVSLTLEGDYEGREGVVPSVTATPDVFSVTALEATTGDSDVTLSWDNPAANITSISISYKIIDSNNSPTILSITESAKIAANAQNVEETIPGLDDRVYYNFTVSLTLGAPDTGREGTAPSVTVPTGPDDDGDGIPNFVDPDRNGDGRIDRDSDGDGEFDYLDTNDDNDAFDDDDDVDDDGDGLIEIATAEELYQVRHNLQGSSLKVSAGGSDNDDGCGNGTTTGEDITTCNGYELSADISLDGFNDGNWQPIGSCDSYDNTSFICTPASSLFSTIFEGNDYVISNLTITPVAPYTNAYGLFGAINSTAVLRNIHIRSADISGDGTNIGMLVGYVEGATIRNSSAEGEVDVFGNNIGGLAGYVSNADIRMSYASGSIRGNDNVGGLIGYGGTTATWYSYAFGSVSGDNNVGGLVGGSGLQLDVILSYVAGGYVSAAGDNVGGLVGLGSSETRIISSYAAGGDIMGNDNVGGLLGKGSSSRIISSYAAPASFGKMDASVIYTNDNFGGLVGDETIFGAPFPLSPPSADYYWDSQTSGNSITRTIGNQDGASEGKTTEELQTPTNFTRSIYANWATNPCDDGSLAWDLGNSTQYPALTCPPGGVAPQR